MKTEKKQGKTENLFYLSDDNNIPAENKKKIVDMT